MSQKQGYLSEIFSSIQGEGLYVGERQLFLRFSGCNLDCQYCDTPDSKSVSEECSVEQTPGAHDLKKQKNPFEILTLKEVIQPLLKNKHLHSAISVTGGEPLLQIDFLLEFLKDFKKDSELPVHLETNGALPQHMDELINYVDAVAMDIKMPSVTGQSSYMKEHYQFMEVVYLSGTEFFVKIAVDSTVKPKDMKDASELIAKIDSKIPLIIQPINPNKVHKDALLSLQAVAKRALTSVRIIPQVHKILKMA